MQYGTRLFRATLAGASVAGLAAASASAQPPAPAPALGQPVPDAAPRAADQPLATPGPPEQPGAADRVQAANPLNTPEIIVRGVRGSLLRSIQTKRDAPTIVDAISAEELGKFPDRNVAEALANIPGVTVGRDGRGEGRDITIRGLGEEFAITTLNGRILPTDTTDRSFGFDVLPSEMISGAEVIKAVQASSLEGSIGGNVDLRTARPFDHKGLQLSGSAEGQYNDLARKGGFKVTGVASDTFADDTIGVLASVSYAQYKFRTDNLGEYSPQADTEGAAGVDFNGNGAIDPGDTRYIYPLFYSNGVVEGKRQRLGVTSAVQWKPGDRITLTLDGLYSHYVDNQRNYRQSNFLAPRNDESSPVKWRPGTIRTDRNNVVTGFTIDDYVAEVLTTNEPRTVDTYQIGGHVDWHPTDRLVVAVDGYTGEAKRNTGGKNAFYVAGIPGSTATFATRDGKLPDLGITIPGGRPIDQATNDDLYAHYAGIQGDDLKDRITSAKFDSTWTTELGPLQSITFGANWTDRRKDDTVIDNLATQCNFCGYPFSFGSIGGDIVRQFPVNGLLSKQPGNFPRRFPVFDIAAYQAALRNAENNPAIINPNTGEPYPAGYSSQTIRPDLPLSFRIRERTWAGYVQANLKGEGWRGDVGVRIVSTDVSSRGFSTTIRSMIKRPGNQADYDVQFNESVPTGGGGNYLRALPAANFSYDFTRKLRLRLAASMAIARPTFAQLSPASDATNAQSGTFIIYDAGNPNLKPTRAKQADASLEYYLSNRLTLNAAVFYKHVTDFVTSLPTDVVITPTDQPAGEQQNFDFTRVVTLNGDKADIVGIEAGGQFFMDNGLGVQANLTYNHSRATTGTIKTDLPGAIPFSANLKLFYEAHGLHTQVSYNYASRFTQAQAGLIDFLPIKEEAYHQMSASIAYDLTKEVQVYAQGSNLLGSAIRRFNTYTNVPAFYEYSGRALFFGVRARI